uniref:Uncharacterized protein n=1 Tax=Arundo donax TaxID=35708 RepID=A0A0A9DQG6_ARUDO
MSTCKPPFFPKSRVVDESKKSVYFSAIDSPHNNYTKYQ